MTKLLPLQVVFILATIHIIFAAVPSLDIKVSALFFDAEDGFWLNRIDALQVLREVLWGAIIAGFVLSLAMVILRITVPAVRKVSSSVFELIILIYISGPILLVNGILKAFWGRARPANIAEFGGTQEFTPAFQISDQCMKNCSFTSGEGSGAAALLIGVILVCSTYKNLRFTRSILTITTLLAVFAMSLRIAMGRHFLSDTIFSFIFVLLLATVFLKLKRYRQFK